MQPGPVVPSLGAASFSCPHCGALAHQSWLSVWAKSYPLGIKPNPSTIGNMITSQSSIDRTIKAATMKAESANIAISNVFLSCCFSCKNYSIWLANEFIHPQQKSNLLPHEDMPENVKADFEEAAAIVDRSPRGAAAILRLAIQKLMRDLGEKGKNLNDDIASLVKKGLEPSIQRALDVVRVIGNNAVHPGEIDLKDDRATAITLLNLVNLVVERRISTQKHIDQMFENLPPGAREAIADRDGES
jgi:hypothetical protein